MMIFTLVVIEIKIVFAAFVLCPGRGLPCAIDHLEMVSINNSVVRVFASGSQGPVLKSLPQLVCVCWAKTPKPQVPVHKAVIVFH